ncbi:hypothetical protein [Streptomyces sp. NRRL F-5123]|uniref:hypothetical protein n=1 Tax=Streptomyces sp. NRRL F-5123 TaxID=1463856 RepID=UPI0004E1FFCB|nr:hypothetical protein [Streptomyces sp. NRRL F-5123]
MIGAVVLGAAGLVFVTLGLAAALPPRTGSRAAWGAVALGVGQLCHAAGMLAGYGGPAGVALSTCSAAFAVGGALLVWKDRGAPRRSRRRKLPPLGG